MTEVNNASESNEKSEFYENKIQRLTNELEIQNQKRNQEMEELFEEMELENKNLKKDLMQTKEELEEEKDKNNNIKNSIYNFNYYQTNISNFTNEKSKPNNIEIITRNNKFDENYYNPASLFCDNIKLIKEQNAKKLSELNIENEKQIKNFEKNKNNLEKNIKSMINSIKNNNLYDNNINIQYNDIINEINSYNNKINSLINENYSNKKYIILLQEKLEYANEEIIFLKERIIQEKKNILEKINEISHMNNLTHINFATEIINEINSKRKNYFNEQFFIPLDNLHQLLLDSKDNEKDLKNKINKLQKDIDEFYYKYEQVNEQKNNLLKNASNYIVEKENDKTSDLVLNSQINTLKKEKEILENENNSLLKNNNELNEQIISINNKILI